MADLFADHMAGVGGEGGTDVQHRVFLSWFCLNPAHLHTAHLKERMLDEPLKASCSTASRAWKNPDPGSSDDNCLACPGASNAGRHAAERMFRRFAQFPDLLYTS